MPKKVDCRKRSPDSVKQKNAYLQDYLNVFRLSQSEDASSISPFNEAPIDQKKMLDVMKKCCH
jgi:hypothetical protein